MGFLRKLFSSGRVETNDPDIRFGRYTDAYKPDDKYAAWDLALDLFEMGKYEESFRKFFFYLTDETQDNIKIWSDEEGIHFEILQGSKLIKGIIGSEMIKAEAKVAKTTDLSIGFLRRLMELNYNMKYGRYALDQDDHITLLFDSYLLDGSPYKMYYALKEIAVSADKQDDLLVKEFKSLVPVNTGHVTPIDETQRRVKISYLREQITDTLKFIDNGNFNSEQFAGGIGYLMLNLAYKLDYLIKPEGELTEALERIHRIYFQSDDKTTSDRNQAVYREYQKILERSDEDLMSELYLVSCSFGITTPGTHEQLVTFIDSELKHMDWYAENRHERIALAFPGYINGYSLFNYAYQPPLRDLMHLYYRITEPEYFRSLGFERSYLDIETETLDRRAILNEIEAWQDDHREQFPKLAFETKSLTFTSLTAFTKSWFRAIRHLDMTKAGR